MSYTPTTWQSGDVISSARLNKIEQGIVEASQSGGGGVVYVSVIGTGETTNGGYPILRLSMTGQQILDAINANQMVILKASPYDFEPIEPSEQPVVIS